MPARTLRLILILSLGLAWLTPAARAAQAPFGPAAAAQIAAALILRQSASIPTWEGAAPGAPVPHYDLAGQVSAYVFPVERGGQDLGYVTVSSQALPNPVLEFSTAPAHVRRAAGLPGVEAAHPLYLGPLEYYFPAAQAGALVAMASGETLSLPDELAVQPPIPLPELSAPEAQAVLPAALAAPAATVKKLLLGPDYDWYKGCGPTAVGNLIGYYADRGFPALVSGGSGGDYPAMIEELALLMNTSPEGMTYLPVSDDILKYTSARGYAFQSDSKSSPTYEDFLAEIDAYRPAVALVNDHILYDDHFITVFGYEYEPANPDYRYWIVHDTWGHGDYWVQYGVGYARLSIIRAAPNSFPIDTLPPQSKVNALPAYQVTPTFTVSWAGSDAGWGVYAYDVQYKDGESAWTPWLTATVKSQANFSGLPGHTYAFRSRAIDLNRNLETYPETADAATQVARYTAVGQVFDSRGPLAMAQVETSPAALNTARTSFTGRFLLGFNATGVYTLTASLPQSPGLVVPLSVTLPVTSTAPLRLFLPPAQEMVANGGFEDGLDGWALGGTVTPTLSTLAHTGLHAVALSAATPDFVRFSEITQTVTISDSLAYPVLSLFYLGDMLSVGNHLTLNVTNPNHSITQSLPVQRSGWQQVSVDLSTFRGQNAVLSLKLTGELDSWYSTIIIDDISIGSVPPRRQVFLPFTRK